VYMPKVRGESWYEGCMLKEQLESLLARVLAWPEAAQDQLVRAVHEIEAQRGLIRSGYDNSRGAIERSSAALSQPGLVADAEIEAFIKRHDYSFF
jgi:hypothetical protein